MDPRDVNLLEVLLTLGTLLGALRIGMLTWAALARRRARLAPGESRHVEKQGVAMTITQSLDLSARSPSGKAALGFAQIRVSIWFSPEKEGMCCEVLLETAPDLPLPFVRAAAEHLLRVYASNSPDGFERAMDLVREGAMKGRTSELPPQK